MRKRIRVPLMIAIGCTLITISIAFRATVAKADDFYRGKILKIIIGSSPGGGFDTYTRTAVRHIGKHIPGNPTPIVQNMPGAGSLITANYIFNRAKPDGLTLGVWSSGLIVQQVLGSQSVKFRADKFGWVGAPGPGIPVCAVMGFTGLRTFDDVLKSERGLKFGASSAGNTTSDMPKILKELFGVKVRVINGYRGSSTIRLAMARREVDGFCISWESMSVTARAMLKAKGDDRLIPFVSHGISSDPEIRHLPRITNTIRDREKLTIFNTWGRQFAFQRPLSLPPGVPHKRLGILRKAYQATLKDPAFLADASKSGLAIEHVPGEVIEKIVSEMLASPQSAKERLRFLVGR